MDIDYIIVVLNTLILSLRNGFYWLIESENKTVKIAKFDQNKKIEIINFNIYSKREKDYYDKLRKIQPKTESKFYSLAY